MFVEDEVDQLTSDELAVGGEGDGDLLMAPLHDVERELDDLVAGVPTMEPVAQTIRDSGGLGDQRVCEIDRCALRLGRRLLVLETLLPGNCQAQRQSSPAVVIARAAQPYELGSDGVDAVDTHDSRRELTQRIGDPWIGPRRFREAAGHRTPSQISSSRIRCSTTSKAWRKSTSP